MIMQKVYAEDNVKGKVLAGWLARDTFIKEVKRSKHYFNLVKGYAIQKGAFDKLIKKGLNHVIIRELDTGKVLKSHIDTWLEHGSIWTGKNGKQRTLSEKYMEIL